MCVTVAASKQTDSVSSELRGVISLTGSILDVSVVLIFAAAIGSPKYNPPQQTPCLRTCLPQNSDYGYNLCDESGACQAIFNCHRYTKHFTEIKFTDCPDLGSFPSAKFKTCSPAVRELQSVSVYGFLNELRRNLENREGFGSRISFKAKHCSNRRVLKDMDYLQVYPARFIVLPNLLYISKIRNVVSSTTIFNVQIFLEDLLVDGRNLTNTAFGFFESMYRVYRTFKRLNQPIIFPMLHRNAIFQDFEP